MTRGGKHVMKMEKAGERPITLPRHGGKTYGKASRPPSCEGRPTLRHMAQQEYRVRVHEEDGAYWAEVDGLDGCFASGGDLDELREVVVEAITLSLDSDGPTGASTASATAHVDEMRVLVSS